MKVLLQITLLLCTFSMYHNNELNAQPADINIADVKIQMTRPKTPLVFPKINAKFIWQGQKLINRDNITKFIVTKKPIMTKFVPQFKLKPEATSKMPVTRRPLMKLKSYTMKTYSNHKVRINDDKNAVLEDIKTEKSRLSEHQSKDVELNLIKPRKDISNVPVHTTPINYYKEETRDRNEYIFLKVNSDNNLGTRNDLLQPRDEDYETTTAKYKLRRKRNINIIEEEIKPTRYPGWKYNEHDTKLNNDRFYNNVNT